MRQIDSTPGQMCHMPKTTSSEHAERVIRGDAFRLAVELAARGLRVTTIWPGTFSMLRSAASRLAKGCRLTSAIERTFAPSDMLPCNGRHAGAALTAKCRHCRWKSTRCGTIGQFAISSVRPAPSSRLPPRSLAPPHAVKQVLLKA